MGGCLGTEAAAAARSVKSGSTAAANVISVNGDLHQYAVPVTVSQVLDMEFPTTKPDAAKFFLSNSDSLCYDDFIPALDAADQLQADRIYFVLPSSKLQYRLAASDMAALAVKASLALQKLPTPPPPPHILRNILLIPPFFFLVVAEAKTRWRGFLQS